MKLYQVHLPPLLWKLDMELLFKNLTTLYLNRGSGHEWRFWSWHSGSLLGRIFAYSEICTKLVSRCGFPKESRCYNYFTYFSPLIFLIYSLHAPTSCLLFLVYILISFYRLSFLSCAALLFMHSLRHSTITHAQSCTVCLLMHSLLRCSLVTQYIRTG